LIEKGKLYEWGTTPFVDALQHGKEGQGCLNQFDGEVEGKKLS